MNVLRQIVEFFLPRRCVACNHKLHEGEFVMCSHCLLANPMDGVFDCDEDNDLVQCLLGCGEVAKANALFEFHPKSSISGIIYDLKYRGKAEVGVLMGRHAAVTLAPRGFFDGVDKIIPVPITRKRRRQRGFNQSEMIARGISEITGIPIDAKSLRRVRFISSQTNLSAAERMANVDGSFTWMCNEALPPKHILLVDDIFTTGATLLSCMRTISENISDIRFTILTLGLTKS